MYVVEEAIFDVPKRFGPTIRALSDEVNRTAETLRVTAIVCEGEKTGRCRCPSAKFVARGLEIDVKQFVQLAERRIYNMVLLSEAGVIKDFEKLYASKKKHAIPNN